MSYNIDTQKTKKLEGFQIPVSALYDKAIRSDWMPEQPQIINIATNEVLISMGGGQSIEGTIVDGMLNVSSIELSGEGSGSLFKNVLDNAFLSSKGTFEAVFVWEGGDSINKYSVVDGIIYDNPVEL